MKKLIGSIVCLTTLAAAACSGPEHEPAGQGGAGAGRGGAGQGGAGTAVAGSSAGNGQAGSGSDACSPIPLIDRVRLLPASGAAATLQGGKIVASNTSPTDGFVDLISITTAPAEGQWTELTLPNPKRYRFMKYYGPANSPGDVAEIEFYAGSEKASGTAFGTTPFEPASAASAAFDGDATTSYRGAVSNDQYVGLDFGAGHVVATPAITPAGGKFDAATQVTIASATPGAVIHYTTNGSDPTGGSEYSAPFKVFNNVTVKAVASARCMLDSPVAQSLFTVGSMNESAQSSFHIGNSLTGPIIAELPAVVGMQKTFMLDFHNCVTAGVDVANFWRDSPAPGCYDLGVNPLKPTPGSTIADPKLALQDPAQLPPIDNLVVQPFAAVACTPYSNATNTGDAGYANNFYQLAKTKNNPNVKLWIYATWAAPTATNWSMVDCFANGSMMTPPWPAAGTTLPPVTDWESATRNHLAYHEAVRSEVDIANGVDPSDPSKPGSHAFVVPVGLALINLKHEVEAGKVHGIAPTDFFKAIYGAGGTDLHINNVGGYFDSLVFYGCFFKSSPEGLPGDKVYDISDEQAADFQRVAWKTVQEYKWSGLN